MHKLVDLQARLDMEKKYKFGRSHLLNVLHQITSDITDDVAKVIIMQRSVLREPEADVFEA